MFQKSPKTLAGTPVLESSFAALKREFAGVAPASLTPEEAAHLNFARNLRKVVRGVEFLRTDEDGKIRLAMVCGTCGGTDHHMPLDPDAAVTCNGCAQPFAPRDVLAAAGQWLVAEGQRVRRSDATVA